MLSQHRTLAFRDLWSLARWPSITFGEGCTHGKLTRSGPIVSRPVQHPPQQTAKICDGSWPKNLWCTLHFQLSKLFCFGTENVNHPMAVGSSYRLCGHPERSVSKYLPASHESSLLGPLIFENRTPIWTSPNTANTLVSCFTW
jgi:hypothetical protein